MGLFPAALPIAFLAAAAHTIGVDAAAVREGCGDDEPSVARVAKGDPVEIRFAVTGSSGVCYKVDVVHGGQVVRGYLPAAALTDLAAFDRGIRTASGVGGGAAPRAPAGPAPATAQAAGRKPPEAAGPKTAEAAEITRLLRAHQPSHAYATARKALAASPKDPQLLALAGVAAYQSDNASDAVDLWEKSLEIAPANPGLREAMEKARREAAGDKSRRVLAGGRFQFRYEDAAATPEQARELTPLLDQEWMRISAQLGCHAEERITAVFQSAGAYRASTGAPEWSAGQYDGRIRVALIEPTPGPATRQAFAHELVHACLARTGQWPSWLHEGLAQKLSGAQLAPADRASLMKQARGGELPPLARLDGGFAALGPEQARAAYSASLLAAELLYAHYGPDGVRSLIQSPERLEQVTADLDRRMRR